MQFWLIKAEASAYSIEDFEREGVTAWTGVRNYQARNFLKQMKRGDQVLFYHSVEEPSGIVGLAKVKREAYPDATQFDKRSEYFDPKASKDNPRWFSPDIEFVKRFAKALPAAALREQRGLSKMLLLQRGSRLSVQPVGVSEFKLISKLLR